MARFADGGYPPYDLLKGVRTETPSKSYYDMICEDLKERALDDIEIQEVMYDFRDDINANDYTLILRGIESLHACRYDYEIFASSNEEDITEKIKDKLEDKTINFSETEVYHRGRHVELQVQIK
jgi:hypothetical protein